MEKRRKRERPLDPRFAERLKKLLEGKGIKKNKDFALGIGRAESLTLDWQDGKLPTYPEDWAALSDFFNVTADYLLLGREHPAERRIDLRRESDKLQTLLSRTILNPKKEYTFRVRIEAADGPTLLSEVLLNLMQEKEKKGEGGNHEEG